MENINSIIQEYLEGQEKQAELKKRLACLKGLILDHAGNNDSFLTDNFSVIVKTSTSIRLDTETLYKDFPDIKKEYSKETISKTLAIAQIASENTKTA